MNTTRRSSHLSRETSSVSPVPARTICRTSCSYCAGRILTFQLVFLYNYLPFCFLFPLPFLHLSFASDSEILCIYHVNKMYSYRYIIFTCKIHDINYFIIFVLRMGCGRKVEERRRKQGDSLKSLKFII